MEKWFDLWVSDVCSAPRFTIDVVDAQPPARSRFVELESVHGWVGSSIGCRTTAVTGPPPRDSDFKTREIGGTRSPHCSLLSQQFFDVNGGQLRLLQLVVCAFAFVGSLLRAGKVFNQIHALLSIDQTINREQQHGDWNETLRPVFRCIAAPKSSGGTKEQDRYTCKEKVPQQFCRFGSIGVSENQRNHQRHNTNHKGCSPNDDSNIHSVLPHFQQRTTKVTGRAHVTFQFKTE